jgi:hypothetical protein
MTPKQEQRLEYLHSVEFPTPSENDELRALLAVESWELMRIEKLDTELQAAREAWKQEGFKSGRAPVETGFCGGTNPYCAGTSAAKAWAEGYKEGRATWVTDIPPSTTPTKRA